MPFYSDPKELSTVYYKANNTVIQVSVYTATVIHQEMVVFH